MRSWMLAGAIAGCAWSTLAHADQCAVIDESTATRAVEVLRRHPDIVFFCEPCGTPAPTEPVRIVNAMVGSRAGASDVVVDHVSIDLAYTYVKTSSHRYENLAALVACPTTGVSPSLAIDDATATGVLIHADTRPVRPEAVEPVERPLPVSAPPALPAPPTIYVVTPAPSAGVGWDGVVLACGLTFAIWWLGTGLRRRRVMRPRATDL